jgi:hypothetical protein
MGEERIKSEEELNGEQEPLTAEELAGVAGGTLFKEASSKSNDEQGQKAG